MYKLHNFHSFSIKKSPPQYFQHISQNTLVTESDFNNEFKEKE